MSGGEGRKTDIDVVHNSIEQCLKHYMSKKDVVKALLTEKNIDPEVTELVWQRLEEQNQEFFKAYYLKLMVKDQILQFNRLLTEQVNLMRRTGLLSMPSMPVPNGSNISPVQQMHLGTNNVHTPMFTNLPNSFINHDPTMNSRMQSALGMSVNGRGVDLLPNMSLPQSSNMGIRPILNGVGIKREADYATSSFNYAAPNNFMRPVSAMADPSLSSFRSVDSSLQPLNGSILDTDASSFGFLGQFSQNFNLHNMTSGVSTSTGIPEDILNGYAEAPFLPSDSNNILDPRGNIARFG